MLSIDTKEFDYPSNSLSSGILALVRVCGDSRSIFRYAKNCEIQNMENKPAIFYPDKVNLRRSIKYCFCLLFGLKFLRGAIKVLSHPNNLSWVLWTTSVAIILLFSASVHPDESIPLEIVHGDSARHLTISHTALDALPQHSVVTRSPYFEGQVRFGGPLLEDVLTHATGKKPERESPVTLAALNDYFVQTTLDVLTEAGAIVATRKDGIRLSIRDRGPYWLILPLSDRPELDNEQYHRLLVWQLSRIKVGD